MRTPTRLIGQLSVLVFVAAIFTLAVPGQSLAETTSDDIYDLVVYGDSSAAVMAAIAAQREGLRVVLVNPTGFVRREGVNWQTPPKPYGISYRSIIPRKGECTNFFVPVCVSASHVAHGSIRMEPVFMALGQAAATAAGICIKEGVSVQEVEYGRLNTRLEAQGQKS